VQAFQKAPVMDLGSKKSVLFLGRMERRKGPEVLIQAFTRLRDLDVRLIIAGEGPEYRHCRALTRSLGVETEFMGRVSEEVKRQLFRSVDAYCAPALGGESFGIVLIEAMAAGCPVICSDLPGFRAVAEEAARLVPPDDAGSLADALREVLCDEDLSLQMRGSSVRIAQAFDWESLAGNVEAIYRNALESARGTSSLGA
jgi:phosphatidylinositol alpha-mannosyltransferase